MAGESVGKQSLHPGWVLAVLAVIVWHGINISRVVSPNCLLSVCYVANLILAAGILIRSGLLIGIGFGWALIALPLWVVNAVVMGHILISSLALHLTGLCAGFMSLRYQTMPRWLVVVAIPVGLVPYLLGQAFTDPQYNLNAAFRVQNGWQSLFPDFHLYVLVQLVVYTVIFLILPTFSNRLIYVGDRT